MPLFGKPYLDVAINGLASVLITGDQDLLILHLYRAGQWEVLEACKWRKENRTSDTKECRYVRNWLI
jgi:predicted nucleic acid-binding protein